MEKRITEIQPEVEAFMLKGAASPRLLIQLVAELLFVVAGLSVSPTPALAEELKESPSNEIGFATVAEAFATLRSRPGVEISRQGGWTIITEPTSRTVWTFPPPGHPAYPSVLKRSLGLRDGSTYLDMKVLCESTKAACDQLVIDFQQLNQRTTVSVQGQRPGASAAAPDQRPLAKTAKSLEEINITSDSAPGWIPSAAQRALVPQTTREFLAALDNGQYQKAYSLMTTGQKAQESFDLFSKRLKDFNAQAGAVKERRILKITWTKDPANAPAPGVYAAVDLASRFENIDRHCGYVILYQRDSASPFMVARQEDNYMTNAAAHEIATRQSPHAADQAWKRLSTNCPNYTPSAPPGKTE